jgi:hypothetical protein
MEDISPSKKDGGYFSSEVTSRKKHEKQDIHKATKIDAAMKLQT